MRCPLAFFAALLALFLLSGGAVIAQTSTPLSKRELRQQDSQECAKQATQQNIAKRNQAEFIRKCMADRQAERKAAAKKQSSDESRSKKGMAAEEWAAIMEVRNRERREELERQAAKRADCNKQANQQKLRLKERRSFVKKCVAG